MNRLQEEYQKEISLKLQKEFNLKNVLAAPKLLKVIINMGTGDISGDQKALEKASISLGMIAGQKPRLCQAKKAIAEFKIRIGTPIGLKVTLRKEKMYSFVDKLFNLVLPKVRDFQGVKASAFDNMGNYTLGLREQIIFPEIDYDKIDKVRGLEITFVTNIKDKKQARRLLELLGLPFEKEQKS